MAAASILVNVKEEVTCPICLALLTQPMSLDCGHSFCKACITSKYNSTVLKSGESTCPVCRIGYRFENLKPSRQLANIAARLRDVKLSPEKEQKADCCTDHGEKLLLFCKKDQKVICWLCEHSQEHSDHQTFLLEEVAQEYRTGTQEGMTFGNDSWLPLQWPSVARVGLWEEQCRQLRAILDSQQSKELLRLREEEEEFLKTLTAFEKELALQSCMARDVSSDLEHRLQGSVVEMLQDVNDILERSTVLTSKNSQTVPKKQKVMFQASDLRRILLTLEELADIRRYWVNMTLTESKNPDVVISADKKQITLLSNLTANVFFPMDRTHEVLGSLAISSGKHYWEVDVINKSAWLLGVSGGSFLKMPFNFGARQNPSYQPHNGFWVIEMRHKSEYRALDESANYEPSVKTLFLIVPPSRVGVFLDYAAGTVSFYNVTDHGSLIYRFSKCYFPLTVFPYFNPLECSAPMTLC
ncbi:tripartite motif-containing protein 5-like [Ctenodactylus gundi]